MNTKVIMLIAALIAVAFIFNFGTAGAIFGTSTLSVSPTTLNGQDVFIVLQNVGSQYDGTTADLNKQSYPNFNTDRKFALTAMKDNDAYIYTATDRSDFSSSIYRYELINHCTGSSLFGGSCNVPINTFRGNCLAISPLNIFFDAGDILNPDWYCYKSVPKWKVSDFNNIGGYSAPEILVLVDEIGAGGQVIDHSEISLSNQHTFDIITTMEGQTWGTVSIEGFSAAFNQPPSSSGIKAIRPEGSSSGYHVVTASALDSSNQIKTQFFQMLNAAKKPNAGQPVITFPMGLFPLGITYYESMNAQQAIGAIDWYNSQVDMLPADVPVGDFQNLDTSQLDSQKKVILKNIYYIPQIKYVLYADAVGVVMANAVPSSITCNSKTLPGGSTTGEFTVIPTNGQTAGSLIIGAACTSPIYVTTTEGAYYFNTFETKQLSFGVTLSPNDANSTCTVTARSSDGMTTKMGTCTLHQTGQCNNSPKPGFYQDVNCVDYCPLTINDCPQPKVLKTPATGYIDQCTCDSGTTPPNTCNNNGQCEAGETLASCPDDCTVQPPQNGTCLPYIQKISTATVGGINIPLIGNIGGTQVSSCVWDFTLLGLALLLAAFALFKMGKGQIAKIIGIVGVAIIAMTFVADNATLLALGGVGLLAIVAVIAGAYLFIRFKMI